MVRNHTVGVKDGEAIIPAAFKPCECTAAWPDGKPKHPPGALHRLARNVTSVSIFMADLDTLEPATLRALLDSYLADGVGFAAYSSFSHTPEKPKARLMIRLPEPIAITSPREWSHTIWPAMMRAFGLSIPADAQCCDASRLYFLPRVATVESPRFFLEGT